MDGSHFDALVLTLSAGHSRRGLGRFLGGLALGGPLAVLGLAETEAKCKKKCGPCKRCKKGKCKPKPAGTACPGGTCQGGSCQAAVNPPVDPCPGKKLCNGACIFTGQCCTRADCPPGQWCCDGACAIRMSADEVCTEDTDCCSLNCRRVFPGIETCAANCRGRACQVPIDCCPEYPCLNVDITTGFGRCGGCKHSGTTCASADECCFSACTARPGSAEKVCWSYAGGPCEKNYDCRSCGDGGECLVPTSNGGTQPICINGVCGCPDECCSDGDCALVERCKFDAKGLNGVCEARIGSPPP